MTEFEQTIPEKTQKKEEPEKKSLAQSAKDVLNKNLGKIIVGIGLAGLGVSEYYDLFGADFTSFDEVVLRGEAPEPEPDELYEDPFELEDDEKFVDRLKYWFNHEWQLNPFRTELEKEMPDGLPDQVDTQLRNLFIRYSEQDVNKNYQEFETKFVEVLRSMYQNFEEQYRRDYQEIQKRATLSRTKLSEEDIEDMKIQYSGMEQKIEEFQQIENLEDFKSFLDGFSPSVLTYVIGKECPQLFELGLIENEKLDEIAKLAGTEDNRLEEPILHYKAMNALRDATDWEKWEAQNFLNDLVGLVEQKFPSIDDERQSEADLDQYEAISALLHAQNKEELTRAFKGILEELDTKYDDHDLNAFLRDYEDQLDKMDLKFTSDSE